LIGLMTSLIALLIRLQKFLSFPSHKKSWLPTKQQPTLCLPFTTSISKYLPNVPDFQRFGISKKFANTVPCLLRN
jgi:hypothetical protein